MKTTQERINDIERKIESEKAKRRRRNRILLSLSSCAAALVLVLSLVLFLPFPTQSVTQYKNSEYYSLICKLEDMRPQSQKQYKNNFEKLMASLQSMKNGTSGDLNLGINSIPPTSDVDWSATAPGSPETPDSPGSSDESSGGGKYEEVTNHQVDGVTEGDLVKRTDRKIYYLTAKNNEMLLDVYPIAGLQTAKSASLTIYAEANTTFSSYISEREMYLSADGERAVVITPCYHKGNGMLYTMLVGVDLTGDSPKETGRFYVSGSYVSSRLVNGKILLVSNFRVNGFHYDDEKQFLPQTGTLDRLESVPMDAITVPENANAARYTVISSIGFDALELIDTAALMSYSDEVYVSQNHIFATYCYSDTIELTVQTPDGDSTLITGKYHTRISCLSYQDGLTLLGSAEPDGTLYDRFSMDEHEGVLRVFVTSQIITPYQNHYGAWYSRNQTSASLYCYSLSDFLLIASKENFAPEGERVFGARFQEKTAYVCTAREFTDPVFEFDLSDYDNITCTDTGTISGFSLYLMPFRNDAMLGIGYGDSRSVLKIELYERGEGEVVSVDKVEVENVAFSSDFKAYCVDQKNGLVGLAVRSYYNFYDGVRYLLFRFDGYNLVQIEQIDFPNSSTFKSTFNLNEVRAFAIDDVFYLFGNWGLKTLALN